MSTLHNLTLMADVRRITGDAGYTPTDLQDLYNRIFVACYMGTENRSKDTKPRTEMLAAQKSSSHLSVFSMSRAVYPGPLNYKEEQED